jgi:hypothetical protein
MAAAVELARPLFLGHWPDRPWVNLITLLIWTASALALATRLTLRRFNS